MNDEKKFRKPGQWKAYITLAYYSFLAQTRNPATFAFGFIFPVVFISIFGLIGNSTPTASLGIPTNSDKNNQIYQSIESQKSIKIDQDNRPSLNKKLMQGKIAGIVEIEKSATQPVGYIVHLTLSQGQPQEAALIAGTINTLVDKTNLAIAHVTTPAVTIKKEEVTGRKSRYIDFALPGQIGFSLLSTAIFGTVFGLIYLKKAGILKRMFATPTQALTILLAQGTSRLIIALLQTILILVIGVFVFQFYLPNGMTTFFELLLISTLGLIAFLGFGYFLAGLASDENAANPLVNLVTLPQFLLSGTFFPIDNLPKWLQPFAANLPLSYFNIAVRKITTESGTLSDAFPYLVGLLLWGAVMYILAARTFKWE